MSDKVSNFENSATHQTKFNQLYDRHLTYLTPFTLLSSKANLHLCIVFNGNVELALA